MTPTRPPAELLAACWAAGADDVPRHALADWWEGAGRDPARAAFIRAQLTAADPATRHLTPTPSPGCVCPRCRASWDADALLARHGGRWYAPLAARPDAPGTLGLDGGPPHYPWEVWVNLHRGLLVRAVGYPGPLLATLPGLVAANGRLPRVHVVWGVEPFRGCDLRGHVYTWAGHGDGPTPVAVRARLAGGVWRSEGAARAAYRAALEAECLARAGLGGAHDP